MKSLRKDVAGLVEGPRYPSQAVVATSFITANSLPSAGNSIFILVGDETHC